MHFSIPQVSEFKDINKGNYIIYHVHANGMLHCKLRYKQFHSIHEKFKKQFGITSLPYFPPKKIFSLNENQIEERRAFLEKYLQIISQDSRISNSNLFNDFLLKSQQDTHNANKELIKIEILLADDSVLGLKIISTDNSNCVKEAICRQLKLPIKYTPYFSLFMVKKNLEIDNDENKIDNIYSDFLNKEESRSLINCNKRQKTNYIIIRKMMDFESPYLSLECANNNVNDNYFLKLIKFYWDLRLDDKLIENDVALDLIYSQAVKHFEKNENEINKDHYQYLKALMLRKSKKEYIKFAKCVKNYGYVNFEPCLSDFPKTNTQCIILIGSNELLLKTIKNNEYLNEYSFRITRIRCWRLTTGLDMKTSNKFFSNGICLNNNKKFNYELSIEYLISKNDLRWIVFKSEQAVLMSICLRTVVEELVSKKNNLPLYEEKSKEINFDLHKYSCNYYKTNDKSLNLKDFTKSASSDTILFSDVDIKQSTLLNSLTIRPLVKNDVFDGINDDDL